MRQRCTEPERGSHAQESCGEASCGTPKREKGGAPKRETEAALSLSPARLKPAARTELRGVTEQLAATNRCEHRLLGTGGGFEDEPRRLERAEARRGVGDVHLLVGAVVCSAAAPPRAAQREAQRA